MEENKDEKHLDDSTTVNQSENPTEEIISIKDPETNIENQETEKMEVHHHAHDPEAPHYKKNWKSYFWEFLMLFLAVFCGFLAESYHTHLINKDIEKRNIESYVNSIKKDADNLKKAINGNRDKIKLIDSLCAIPGDFNDATFQKDFFNYSGQLVSIYDFSPDEFAFLNMQSSGALRLIEKQNILDSILKYQSQNVKIKKHQESTNKIYFAALDNLLQVADLRKNPPQFNGNNQPDNLKKAINGNRDKIKLIDSLCAIPGDFNDATFQKDFFNYSGQLVSIYDFSPDESAFLNMQSSGALRLIEKQNILDSILKYQSQNVKIKKHQESTNKIYFAALDNLLQVADLRKNPPQFNGNNQQLQTYINNKILESGMTGVSIRFLEQQLKTATNLIALVKKEYDLDD